MKSLTKKPLDEQKKEKEYIFIHPDDIKKSSKKIMVKNCFFWGFFWKNEKVKKV